MIPKLLNDVFLEMKQKGESFCITNENFNKTQSIIDDGLIKESGGGGGYKLS
ncbi:hypothetical protein [uncultured Helicobacter sp.]|uniref:hypothetical protein n=1 Tax=uncultured Helicobacter sp. TaxID=175537 RepID=UPI00262FCD74|nr:hypothetical protein [uncultured Helicobacter sp.]